ncbi:protein-L-isoaspartate(D-aspartate) O-methyltransferase [Streptomyces sp. F63]|uniref:methyltransferase domain-containing protein n=1 Tax=Streptomyces sp. F63 TaxID=2824887 RepID=UPI001B389A53|nr:methyltransferase domain-containing protein [Streptomyces sp. F63]MBQ0983504.1 protein-L-isoaspartate(D-aspartate) O-methyltransferase [Streptomyces sp. F63]
MDWNGPAERLAAAVTHPVSRWRPAVASTPRHLFVPRWWQPDGDGWELRDGPADEARWASAAYSYAGSLVTRVGPLHADHARPGDRPTGLPTSSSTHPSLVVRMLRHGMISDSADLLIVGTGSGYSTALACARLGAGRVTSVDVDGYLVKAATERLASAGLASAVRELDATGPLPGSYDRIVSMVAVRPVPASWLAALRPGGRLVTTLENMPVIVTADKSEDGGADGEVQWDRAGFMRARHGTDYPHPPGLGPGLGEQFAAARDQEGEHVGTGRYPVLNVQEAWDVWSMLELTAPGIEHRFEEGPGRRRTAWMAHPDGSWARATASWTDPPEVHQSGPRRLWDELERIRTRLNTEGALPVYGAKVRIDPDGTVRLRRGKWSAVVP